MYLRAAKPDLEALGEDTEDCANSVAELREKLIGLTNVDIMLDDKTFKSTYKIIQEISREWENLADVDRAAVTKLIGGKRNANVVQALITNFQDAERVVAAAQGAIGSATKENEQYLDSIAGKLDLLKGSYQAFSEALISSDVVKFGVDVLNTITKIATVFAGLPGVIKAPLLMLVALTESVTVLNPALAALGKAFKVLSPSSIAGVITAHPFVGWVAGITAVIAGIAGIVGWVSRARESAIQAANDSADAFKETNDQYEANQQQLDKLRARYEKLSAGVDEQGQNVALTAAEYEEYKSIVQQIIDISPAVVQGYNDEGEAIVQYAGLIDEAKQKLQELHQEQAKDYFADQQKRINGWSEEYQAALGGLNGQGQSVIGSILGAYFDRAERFDFDGSTIIDTLIDKMVELGIITQDRQKEFQDLASIGAYNIWLDSDEITGLYNNIDKLKTLLASVKTEDGSTLFKPEDLTAFENIIRQTGNYIREYQEEIKKYTDDYRQYVETLPEYLNNQSAPWLDEFMTYLDQMVEREVVAMDGVLDANAMQTRVKELFGGVSAGIAEAFASDEAVKRMNEAVDKLLAGAITQEQYAAELDQLAGMWNVPDSVMSNWDVYSVLIAYFDSFIQKAPEVASGINEAEKAVVGFADATKKLKDSYDVMGKALSEMKTDGSISADTIEAIYSALGDGEHISDYLYEENGLIKLNIEAWRERAKAAIESDLAIKRAQLSDAKSELASYMFSDDPATAARISELDQLVADLTVEIRAYEQALGEMGTVEDPLNVTQMLADADAVKSKVTGLYDALDQLRKGDALNTEQWSKLTSEYPELMRLPFNPDDIEVQKNEIETVLRDYQSDYEAIIQQQIDTVQAARDKVAAEGGFTFIFDAMLENLMALQDIGLTDGSSGFDKTTEALGRIDDIISLVRDIPSEVDLSYIEKLREVLGEDWQLALGEDGAVDIEYLRGIVEGEIEATEGAQELAGAIMAAFYAAAKGEDVKSRFDRISDAMDKAKANAELMAAALNGDGISWDVIEKAYSTLGEDAEKYLIKGADGLYTGLDNELLRINTRATMVAEGASKAQLAAFDAMWQGYIDGAEKAAEGFEALAAAMSDVGTAQSLLKAAADGETGIIDMLDKIAAFADKSKIDMAELITVDEGKMQLNEERVRQYINDISDVYALMEQYGLNKMEAVALSLEIRGAVEAKEEIDELGEAISKVTSAMNLLSSIRSGNGDFFSMFQSAMEMAEESKRPIEDFFTVVNGDLKWSEQAVIDYANTWIDSMEGIENVSDETRAYMKRMLQEQVKALTESERIEAILKDTHTAIDNMASANVNTQVTYDQFKSLIDISTDYAGALEYNAGLITLNKEKFDEVTEAILQNKLAEVEALKQEKLMSKEYQDLNKMLSEGRKLDTDQQARLNDMNAEIMAYEALAGEIINASAAYQQFMNQSDASSGEQYTAAQKAFKVLQDTLTNEKSDIFGKVGRAQFKKAQEFLIRPEVDMDEAMATLKRYFADAREGAQNFVDDLRKKEFIDDNGVLNANIQAIADAFGLTVDGVLAGLEEINQYLEEDLTYVNPDTGEATNNLAELAEQAGTTKEGVGAAMEAAAANIGDLEARVQNVQTEVDSILTDHKVDVNTDQANSKLDGVAKKVAGVGSAISGIGARPLSINTVTAQANLGKVSSSLSDIVNYLNDIASRGVISINIQENHQKTSSTESPAGVSGYGVSAAKGVFGAPGGRTLVGEKGREIVVDPHTNRWYTVGEHGAEFVDMPRGAIVFNADQTARLLGTGKVSERGASMASGNLPNIVKPLAQKDNGKMDVLGLLTADKLAGSKTKSSSSTSSKKAQARKAVEEVKDEAKETKNLFDWIEIAISRLERSIDRIGKSASNTFKTLTDRLKSLKSEQKKVTDEIKLQEKAYNRYMKQANSVGLSSALKKKVQDGSISIKEYDEDVQTKINEYQEWYEKALACKDAIQDLKITQSELLSQKFDMTQQAYSDRLDRVQARADQWDANAERSRYTGASKRYNTMVDINKDSIKILKTEAKDLEKQLSGAVSSGKIKKGSEEWHKMKSAIEDVNLAIKETGTATQELYIDRFNDIVSEYSNAQSSLQHAIAASNNDNALAAYTGGGVSVDAQMNQHRKLLASEQKELNALQKQMQSAIKNGDIKEGSDAWYEMLDAINAANEKIQDTKLSLQELNASRFDKVKANFEMLRTFADDALTHFQNILSKSEFSGGNIGSMFGNVRSQIAKDIGILENEAKRLQDELNTAVENGLVKGSDEYKKRAAEVNAVLREREQKEIDLASSYQEEFNALKQRADAEASLRRSLITDRQNIALDATAHNGGGKNSIFGALIHDSKRDAVDLTNELNTLKGSLANALNSGQITMYSNAWYEMKQTIAEVENEIAEKANETAQLYMDRFDAVSEKYDTLLSENDRALNALETESASMEYFGGNRNNVFDRMISERQERTHLLWSETAALKQQMQDALAGGYIKEGSEDWYKMREAIDAATQAYRTNVNDIMSLYKDKFDEVSSRYQKTIEDLERDSEGFSRELSQIEERGYLGGANLYKKMIAVERRENNERVKEAADLQKKLDEAVKAGLGQGSDAWREMHQAIEDVNIAIQESETEIISLSKEIRQMNWDAFDYLQERISDIADESEFLIELMDESDLFNDHGTMSNTGVAQMGLLALNYDTYMAQATQYGKELAAINAELAKDKNNKELIDRRKELLGLQRDSVLAAEQEKDAVADLVEKGINLQLEAMRALIDAYNKSLDDAKALHDYQKGVQKQTEKIAALQKQMSAYAGDTSEENRARLQKLSVELSGATEELRETEYDKSIENQKKLLDELYSDFEATLNGRLDNVDALMAEAIDTANGNSRIVESVIREESSKVGMSITSEMAAIWSSGGVGHAALTSYGANVNSQLTGLSNTLGNIAANVYAIANGGGGGTSIGAAHIGGFASGGYVADAQKAACRNGDNLVTINTLKKGEAVFTAAEYKQIGKLIDSLPQLHAVADVSKYLGVVARSGGITPGGLNIGNISVPITIEHAADADDLVRQIQNDSRIENMIMDMTVNRLAGKSRLNKYKYQ